jgi:glutamyl-tRNA synthetase
MTNKIVTRFAPSPTGLLHIGAYRTAIFAFLYARHMGGEFVLRIEDTDKERNKKEYEENILESLGWMGLSYDRFYRQSENIERHRGVLRDFVERGIAYVSKEEAKDGSGVIRELIRFKNPNKVVTFVDTVVGEVKTDTTDLGDFILAKDIDNPLFHLAVVVDDNDEGVTHVIRGADHISNTPRHILIYEALNASIPTYTHLPLVTGQDKLKLSKRRGAKSITEYRDMGYMPSAILNMSVLMGWNPGTEQEIFSLENLIEIFDVTKVQKSPAMFNIEKLNWVSREHIKLMNADDQIENIKKFTSLKSETIQNIREVIIERIHNFGDVKAMEDAGEFAYYENTPKIEDAKRLIWKTSDKEKTIANLKEAIKIINENDDIEKIVFLIKSHADIVGKGDILWPIRYALSAKEKSPDPFTLLKVLGTEESRKRLENAIIALDESK